MLRILDTTLSS